jgi:hypothetical protein
VPIPYSGNDANCPTAVNIISGGDAPSATNFQAGYEGTLDRTSWLLNRGGLSSLVTLQPGFNVLSISGALEGPFAAAFNDTSLATDPTAGQTWLLLLWDLTHISVYSGYGDGTKWTQLGANINYTQSGTSICVDTAGNVYVAGVAGVSSTEGDVYQKTPGGAFTSFLVVSGVATPSDLQIAALGTAFFYAIGSTTAANAAVSGGFGGGFSGLTVSSWIVRSSPTMVLFVPAQAMAAPIVYKATGTATYTSASIGLATTDVPLDLTWSAVWNLWFLVAKTAGGASTIWSSPDGAVWTLVKTLSALPMPMTGIAAIGQHLVAVLGNPATKLATRLVSSSDGSVTWYPESTGAVDTTTKSGIARVVAGPNQVLTATMLSRGSADQTSVRFSGVMGRGDQALT